MVKIVCNLPSPSKWHWIIFLPATLDEETKKWPISDGFKDQFDAIKFMYKASLLAIYKDESFIEPLLANSALKNSLVKVHFNIHHYCIGDYDTFAAIPLQILILKDAPCSSSSPYKWKNVREGPIHPKNFELSPSSSIIHTPSSSLISPMLQNIETSSEHFQTAGDKIAVEDKGKGKTTAINVSKK